MRGPRAAVWLTSLVTLGLLMLVTPTLPRAGAQAPGTLVLGLDQEPPTLDPHASPSPRCPCSYCISSCPSGS